MAATNNLVVRIICGTTTCPDCRVKGESAFSGIGVVADQTRHAQSVVEAAIAEVHSVCDEVSSRIVEIAKRADVSVSSIAGCSDG